MNPNTTNNRVTPAPERFTIVNGKVETIALKYSNGKRVNSRIPGAPDQVMFTLADGRRAFLPLEVAEEIDALKLAPGQPFTICKNGPRDWDVQYAHAATPAESRQMDFPQSISERMNGSGEKLPEITKRCYADAIEIAVSAVELARLKGLMITPSFEDVRCLAATLVITATGGRR